MNQFQWNGTGINLLGNRFSVNQNFSEIGPQPFFQENFLPPPFSLLFEFLGGFCGEKDFPVDFSPFKKSDLSQSSKFLLKPRVQRTIHTPFALLFWDLAPNYSCSLIKWRMSPSHLNFDGPWTKFIVNIFVELELKPIPPLIIIPPLKPPPFAL